MKNTAILKTAILLITIVIFSSPVFSFSQDTVKINMPDSTISRQETASKPENKKVPDSNKLIQVKDGYDGTDVVVGRYGNIIVSDKYDTLKIKIGSKGVRITETYDGTNVEIIDPADFEEEFNVSCKRHFKGHWAGFEIGMNNYVNPGFYLPDDYMSLNTGKSWNVNINFIQYSLNIANNSFGLVTGLGFQMNDYKFNGNNSIEKDPAGDIIELPRTENLKMSKLHADYLSLPLILEIHPSSGRIGRKFYFGAGIIGTMKIRSYTKLKYYVDGEKNKEKTNNDYNISPLQYAVTFRAGYRALKVFANYNLQALFQANHSPELYPFSIGLVLLSF